MLLERGVGGNTVKLRAVERAFRQRGGMDTPYFEIAAQLYEEFRSSTAVRQEIQDRFGVEISEKTASLWINRGLEERRAALSAQSNQGAQVDACAVA